MDFHVRLREGSVVGLLGDFVFSQESVVHRRSTGRTKLQSPLQGPDTDGLMVQKITLSSFTTFAASQDISHCGGTPVESFRQSTIETSKRVCCESFFITTVVFRNMPNVDIGIIGT